MRLLQYNRDESFTFTNDLATDVPEYAILSHTWGSDFDEVTYRDLVDGAGKGKAGYEKLSFCAKQATHDGLQYFWVDTCCIDKASQNELSEAINSMFRWYQNSARCYVYLSDISVTHWGGGKQPPEIAPEVALGASRWFTRGWTLQELLAPSSVEFFTRDGYRLGDKKSLEQKIHDITGISIPALRGNPLSQFSVEERLKWAETRQTSREEDWAYSLLGIFGVFMPLIYGEGKDNALRRLKNEVARLDDHSQRYSSTSAGPGKLGVTRESVVKAVAEESAKEALLEAEKELEQRRMGFFMSTKLIRGPIWGILHAKPWTVITEDVLMDTKELTKTARFWTSGQYRTVYPEDEPGSEIILSVDWGLHTELESPVLDWAISTADSLFYPGVHTGRLELKKRRQIDSSPLDLFNTVLKMTWESGIFSPFPDSDTGFMSSVGPLEEGGCLVLTQALQSLAYSLIHGPFAPPETTSPGTEVFAWHKMGGKVRVYFDAPKYSVVNSLAWQDRSIRAAAFFSNALNRDLESLGPLDFVRLPEHCLEVSRVACGELVEFYNLEGEIQNQIDAETHARGESKHVVKEPSWILDLSYSPGEIRSYSAWICRDRVWAGRIARLAGLKLLARAAAALGESESTGGTGEKT